MFPSISVSTWSTGRLQTPEVVTPTWLYYHFHRKVVIRFVQMTTRSRVASWTANPPARPHRNTSSPSGSHQRTRQGGEVVGKRILINNLLDSPVTDILARQIAHPPRGRACGSGPSVRDLLEQVAGIQGGDRPDPPLPPDRRAPQAPTNAYRDHDTQNHPLTEIFELSR